MRLRISSLPLAIAALAVAPAAFAAGPLTVGEYGSFSVDAMVMHEAAPDIINLNVTCEFQSPMSRAQLREEMQAKQRAITAIVGSDGQVRRTSSPAVYPFFEGPTDPLAMDGGKAGLTMPRFTGNFAFVVRNVKTASSPKISDGIEDLGCGVNWDVRLLRTAQYARQYRAQLMEQIDEKKAVYEEILGKPLSRVSNMGIYTSVDYGYYGGGSAIDPETLTVPAVTTLNMTFDFGTGEKSAPEMSRR